MIVSRLVVATGVLLLSACATLGLAGAVDVEVLETGYLVSNNVLASSAELKDFLVGQDVRQVRLMVPKGAPAARVSEANAAIRDAGVTAVETVNTAPK